MNHHSIGQLTNSSLEYTKEETSSEESAEVMRCCATCYYRSPQEDVDEYYHWQVIVISGYMSLCRSQYSATGIRTMR